MGTEVVTTKKCDYICRYYSKTSTHSEASKDEYECRELYLSRQQAELLALLHRTKSFPIFRIMIMYNTSHVHADILQEPFFISNGMVSEEDILESSNNLRRLSELGLLEMDFGGKDRLYVFHSLEDGKLFKEFLQKYNDIPHAHPLIQRGIIRLTTAGRTTELICRK